MFADDNEITRESREKMLRFYTWERREARRILGFAHANAVPPDRMAVALDLVAFAEELYAGAAREERWQRWLRNEPEAEPAGGAAVAKDA